MCLFQKCLKRIDYLQLLTGTLMNFSFSFLISFRYFFLHSLRVCMCVCEWKLCPVFRLCNFIASFFSAWPGHLARLALAISKWLCSVFHCNFFTLYVFIFYCKIFWAQNKDCCCCCCELVWFLYYHVNHSMKLWYSKQLLDYDIERHILLTNNNYVPTIFGF